MGDSCSSLVCRVLNKQQVFLLKAVVYMPRYTDSPGVFLFKKITGGDVARGFARRS